MALEYKFIIMDVGLGVKNILKVIIARNQLSKRYCRVNLVDYPRSWDSAGKTCLINGIECLMVDKKYLFDSIEEAENYLENEV